MILLLHKIDILTNKTFIEERNIRKKVTKFSSHDEVTHFDGTILVQISRRSIWEISQKEIFRPSPGPPPTPPLRVKNVQILID